MPQRRDPEYHLDRVVILFLLALFVLVSPLRDWWAADSSPWYTPYLIWGGVLLLAFRLDRDRQRHDV